MWGWGKKLTNRLLDIDVSIESLRDRQYEIQKNITESQMFRQGSLNYLRRPWYSTSISPITNQEAIQAILDHLGLDLKVQPRKERKTITIKKSKKKGR